jgi:hypothetical protein
LPFKFNLQRYSTGGRAYGGLSARVAQLHKALRATRHALLRERQCSLHFQKMYAGAAQQAKEAEQREAVGPFR